MKVYIKLLNNTNRKIVGSIRFGIKAPIELFIVPVESARCIKFSITSIQDTRKNYIYSYRVNGKIYKKSFRKTARQYDMATLIRIPTNNKIYLVVEVRDKTGIRKIYPESYPESYQGFYLYKIL